MPLAGSDKPNGKLCQHLEILYIDRRDTVTYIICENPETFKARFQGMLKTGFFVFNDIKGRDVVINLSNICDMKNWTGVESMDSGKKEEPEKIIEIKSEKDKEENHIDDLQKEISEEAQKNSRELLNEALGQIAED